MAMVTKTAFDPSTEEEYEVEMPAPEEVRKGILELEFPLEGIRLKDAVAQLADKFQLSDKQRNAKYKSGNNVFYVNVVRREFRRLLDDGKLAQPKGKRTPYCRSPTPPRPPSPDPAPTPEPSVPVAETYRGIRKKLEETLLEELRDIHHTFFEKLVIKLLEKMGYGAGEVLGGSRDDGIDGIITDDDRLELYRIYVQAKRWENKVGKPDIQQFAGALLEQDATMGIFVTTSRFTSGAREFAENTVDPKIVLVDGKQLARLLLEYNVFHN